MALTQPWAVPKNGIAAPPCLIRQISDRRATTNRAECRTRAGFQPGIVCVWGHFKAPSAARPPTPSAPPRPPLARRGRTTTLSPDAVHPLSAPHEQRTPNAPHQVGMESSSLSTIVDPTHGCPAVLTAHRKVASRPHPMAWELRSVIALNVARIKACAMPRLVPTLEGRRPDRDGWLQLRAQRPRASQSPSRSGRPQGRRSMALSVRRWGSPRRSIGAAVESLR